MKQSLSVPFSVPVNPFWDKRFTRWNSLVQRSQKGKVCTSIQMRSQVQPNSGQENLIGWLLRQRARFWLLEDTRAFHSSLYVSSRATSNAIQSQNNGKRDIWLVKICIKINMIGSFVDVIIFFSFEETTKCDIFWITNQLHDDIIINKSNNRIIYSLEKVPSGNS